MNYNEYIFFLYLLRGTIMKAAAAGGKLHLGRLRAAAKGRKISKIPPIFIDKEILLIPIQELISPFRILWLVCLICRKM